MKPDKIIINKFLDHLRLIGRVCNEEPRYPDDENRNEKDIDCVCGNIAIEHTSIDFFKNGRTIRDLQITFQNYLYKLLNDSDLTSKFILMIPNDLKIKGKNWKLLAEKIFFVLQANQKLLNSNRLEKINFNDSHIFAKINKKGINKIRFYIDSESAKLHSGVKNQLIDKIGKFQKYLDFNKILLIELNDAEFDIESGLSRLIVKMVEEKSINLIDEIWIIDSKDSNISFLYNSHLLAGGVKYFV